MEGLAFQRGPEDERGIGRQPWGGDRSRHRNLRWPRPKGGVDFSKPPSLSLDLNVFILYPKDFFLKKYPPTIHCPDLSSSSPHFCTDTFISVLLLVVLSLQNPPVGLQVLGRLHVDLNLTAPSPLQPLSNWAKIHWSSHCQCLELSPPAGEGMIVIALKSIWSFTPHPQSPSCADRDPQGGSSFPFESVCFELSLASL